MKTECGHFGTLVNVIIPSPNPNGNQVSGVGKVFFEYADTKNSTKARTGLYGTRWCHMYAVLAAHGIPQINSQMLHQLSICKEVLDINISEWFTPAKNGIANQYEMLISDISLVERLTTQDKVRKWGSYDLMMCPLCSNDMDSHNHLFFECEFSNKLWNMVKRRIEYHSSGQNWQDIITELSTLQNGNTIGSIIRRLCFAACVYLIWQERNNRIFKNEKRSNESMFIILNDTIKWRLSSLKFKSSQAVLKAAEIWGFKNECYMKLNSRMGSVKKYQIHFSWHSVSAIGMMTASELHGCLGQLCPKDPKISICALVIGIASDERWRYLVQLMHCSGDVIGSFQLMNGKCS
ncbi:reverse transcriptase zinc-binding domain-containing protein [Tanacetum coccineum]